MDLLDLLEVQGTLRSLLQHHSSKVSTLRHSAFFIVQLSHPYMTTGKNIALTLWTFVSKVMSLLFNTMSDLVFTKAGLWVTGAQSVTHAQSCLATQSAHGSCFSLKSFSLWSGRLCPQVAMGSFSFLGKATLD